MLKIEEDVLCLCADQSLAIFSILATLATPPRDFPISNISANQFLWPIWAELLGHAQPAELCSEATPSRGRTFTAYNRPHCVEGDLDVRASLDVIVHGCS